MALLLPDPQPQAALCPAPTERNSGASSRNPGSAYLERGSSLTAIAQLRFLGGFAAVGLCFFLSSWCLSYLL